MTISLADQFEIDVEGIRLRALLDQCLIQNCPTIGGKVAKAVRILPLVAGQVLVSQDEPGNEMYFILSGSISVIKNNREKALRARGTHVGEMALVEIGACRSATLRAKEDSIIAAIAEKDFSEIATIHPELWRRIAIELARRLREITPQIEKRNDFPRIFMGSSSEALPVLNGLKPKMVSPNLEIKIWDQDIFRPSKFALECLEETARDYDFAIFAFHPDDKIFSRWRLFWGTRDNVVFETGLFIGALGRQRTYILKPRGVKMPSDLAGFTTINYDLSNPDSLNKAAEILLQEIGERGPK